MSKKKEGGYCPFHSQNRASAGGAPNLFLLSSKLTASTWVCGDEFMQVAGLDCFLWSLIREGLDGEGVTDYGQSVKERSKKKRVQRANLESTNILN